MKVVYSKEHTQTLTPAQNVVSLVGTIPHPICELAWELELTEETVKRHIAHIKAKEGLKSLKVKKMDEEAASGEKLLGASMNKYDLRKFKATLPGLE